MPVPPNSDLLDLVANIVAAHLTYNSVASEALPGVIRSVYTTLNNLGIEAPAAEKPEPAVPIKKSVFPDHIICLEDGKKLETLKRHLRASHGMTPEEYRTRWSLPRDYPMVAPKYAARRSAIAKEVGLGRTSDRSQAQYSPPIRRVAEGVRGKHARRTASHA
jgi:predicted transcriptional regulator